MIGRVSTLLLANLYQQTFYGLSLATRESISGLLNDFLYGYDYDDTFRHAMCKASEQSSNGLKMFVMELYTGDSIRIAQRTTLPPTEKERALGQGFLHELAINILNSRRHFEQYSSPNTVSYYSLIRQLETDGYKYEDGKLLPIEETILDPEERRGALESLYLRLGLANKDTAISYLKLSAEHYTEGRWEDSTGNGRKFLEAVLSEVADSHKIDCTQAPLDAKMKSKPVEVRNYLEKEKLIDNKEKTALDAVYGLLSNRGSHPRPDMANNDEARLARYLALTFSEYIMLRFEAWRDARPK